MADYPEWVMRHKTKGTYINCVKGRYYLYKAHSERVPGTKKVKRVFDGYIGRITEEDGLVPARDKVTDEVIVHEYGLCMTMLALCADIAAGLRRELRAAAERVLVAGLLEAAYGDSGQETYEYSYLSLKFPGHDMTKALTDRQRVAKERCVRMASDVMSRRFGKDSSAAATHLSRVHAVVINGRFYRSKISGGTEEWLLNHGVEWSD